MLIFFDLEMVGLIGPEHSMMNQCVASKGVGNLPNGAVHQESMQSPFKKRGVNKAQTSTDSRPEYKMH
jgi:hypothetical protein